MANMDRGSKRRVAVRRHWTRTGGARMCVRIRRTWAEQDMEGPFALPTSTLANYYVCDERRSRSAFSGGMYVETFTYACRLGSSGYMDADNHRHASGPRDG